MSSETYKYTSTAIRTYTGRRFDYLQSAPDDICIFDIAVHLAREPRWLGATDSAFHVGQHCVQTCDHVKTLGGTKVEQLLGLMHDATEAYTKDIPRPMKNVLPGYKELENKIWDRICLHFFKQTIALPAIIKKVDGMLLNAENRDLRAYYHDDETLTDVGGEVYPNGISPWEEHDIIFAFLSRFNILYTDSLLRNEQWKTLQTNS